MNDHGDFVFFIRPKYVHTRTCTERIRVHSSKIRSGRLGLGWQHHTFTQTTNILEDLSPLDDTNFFFGVLHQISAKKKRRKKVYQSDTVLDSCPSNQARDQDISASVELFATNLRRRNAWPLFLFPGQGRIPSSELPIMSDFPCSSSQRGEITMSRELTGSLDAAPPFHAFHQSRLPRQ